MVNIAKFFSEPVKCFEITVESNDGKEKQVFWQHMTKSDLGLQVGSIFEMIQANSKFKNLTNMKIRILD